MPKSYKTVEIEQQERFSFTRETCERILDGWSVVRDYAWIVHDKDFKKDGSPKEPHIHCMIRFNDSVPTTAILARAKAVCGSDSVVKEEQLQKCKTWKGAVAYLTHENVTGKHIYNRSEIVSNYNFEEDIEDALTEKNRLNLLLEGIGNGAIKDYNIYEYCTIQEYSNWKTKIDSAFAYRAKMLLNKGDRDMKCMYIQGDSGTGKTSYAKEVCENKEYSYFVSSGSNDVLDGYGGQDAIILDDLRPNALSLADLLKMLDNNTSSSVKSRYRNKVLECRLIIITTTLDINSFFHQVFSEQPETAKQLRRRCETLVKMTVDTMEPFVYDKGNDVYISVGRLPNPIAVKYGLTKERSKEILADSLLDLLGKTAGMAEALEKWKTDDTALDGFIKVDESEDAPWK
jgi:hypothetical protein